jgi:hypothetical protein
MWACELNDSVPHTMTASQPRWTSLSLALSLVVLAGCQSLLERPEEQVICAISIHAFAAQELQKTRLARSVEAAEGRAITVRSTPLLTSHNIMAMDAMVDPSGRKALRAVLDKHGQTCWLQACAQYPGERLAVLVDGVFRFSMTVPANPPNDGSFYILGPWADAEMKSIAEHAIPNYKLLNN